MTKRKMWVIGLLALAIIALAGRYFFSHFERYSEVIDHGPSPAARANPYLAAEQFLRQRLVPVNVTHVISNLPDARSDQRTLLLLASRENMTPRQVDQLLNWTKSGGHLLFIAEQLWDEHKGRSGDLLLDRVQVHQVLSANLQAPDHRNSNPLKPSSDLLLASPPPSESPQLTKLYLENESDPAYFSFDTRFHLEDPKDHAQTWANSDGSTHMMQLVYGDGLITVLTDSDLWKNNAIDHFDNAWLLWYLTQHSAVTMLLQVEHGDLFSLLLRYFPQAIITLALMTGLLLWHIGMRHGPLQAPESRARRQLVEHLRASADFLLRSGGQYVLLSGLQQDILRRARQRHPGFERLSVADQWQVLARLTQQPTSAIGQALRPRPNKRLSATEFTRQVAHLQTLRNAL
ncbi:DUF4350 domain-containing protein [Pseudomonas sp. 10B1]|uniref:DUF4350 domain-containing protein n=1 Tax=unclassified Pseudomonas TaxID=196821 RepID=UPI002AB45E7E|nr:MULTISPECIES: DUF4350 domain-containing protein [unclassified Pseudomonas]MDY7561757.1 DUF4350 domain-containing protein [Pseudomonas sp. AB6]MEA9996327.1 DUF4350 domain-containing protein [Pseudomonas sp. AA4]MEB0085867.1 DUF4350 domain-containing protein [Pseudomonas sp. RTI1]MEB0125808.1 DUF4350 domain-containing protein [Pseudomonas sp. CCC1.2]MEB0154376.1 DUF4350 domain-containing protein [Pseudomonas sp. CCC4.3]